MVFGSVNLIAETDSLQSVKYGNAPENIRSFDQEKLNDYKSQDAFDYEVKTGGFNFWLWLSQKLEAMWNWLFGNRKAKVGDTINPLMDVLLWAIGIAVVVLVVMKLIGVNFNTLVFRESDIKRNILYETLEENIHELDFNDLIQKAIDEKNYRYAIRLHYLKTLKQLNDKSFIDWKPGKTNMDYINEMNQNSYGQTFNQITRLFNYVWYGDKLLDAENFSSTREDFIIFDQQIQQLNA